ncbi:unnamed protein product [Peniophora sp. CBMAI 1063]|nr:unnamed protein product [Peniophora sp. CBMAI 1063]
MHFNVLAVSVAHAVQDLLGVLQLQLCDARIAVEHAAANNEPLAVQELATLQVEHIELQVKQETARVSTGFDLLRRDAPADKAVGTDAKPSFAAAVDEHDEDTHDTGDNECELIGEGVCQPESVDRGTLKPRKESTVFTDIDDAGVRLFEHLPTGLILSITNSVHFGLQESRNDFEDRTAKAPAQTPLMGSLVSKSRFGLNFHDPIKKEPKFSTGVAVRYHDASAAIVVSDSRSLHRHSALADVIKMHGTHGIAAIAHALLEAYNGDKLFAGYVLPRARELTTILDIAIAKLSTPVTDTKQLPLLVELLAPTGNEKKRDASHLDAEAGPPKRASRLRNV